MQEEHLKKYTAPSCKKQYYEMNKEEIKNKHKEYTPTEEQKKKWARTAYLKKKEKLENERNMLGWKKMTSHRGHYRIKHS